MEDKQNNPKPQESANQVDQLLSAGFELVEYVKASRTVNTPEYMKDLAFYINNFLKAGGRKERYLFDGKDTIIKSR